MSILVQLSDCHIDNSDEELSSLDPRSNFLRVLDELSKIDFDRLIISGDISESKNGKEWIFDQLKKRSIECDVVMGNHDDVLIYKQPFFEAKNRYKAFMLNGFKILYLDSSKGMIDKAQFEWLVESVSNDDQNIVIFIHHPIIDCGNTTMDKLYPLKKREEVEKILFHLESNIYIFCGHYHSEMNISVNNVRQFVTPSTLFQLKKNTKDLEIESTSVGYRVIHLNNGDIRTEVRYV